MKHPDQEHTDELPAEELEEVQGGLQVRRTGDRAPAYGQAGTVPGSGNQETSLRTRRLS